MESEHGLYVNLANQELAHRVRSSFTQGEGETHTQRERQASQPCMSLPIHHGNKHVPVHRARKFSAVCEWSRGRKERCQEAVWLIIQVWASSSALASTTPCTPLHSTPTLGTSSLNNCMWGVRGIRAGDEHGEEVQPACIMDLLSFLSSQMLVLGPVGHTHKHHAEKRTTRTHVEHYAAHGLAVGCDIKENLGRHVVAACF